MRLFFQDGFRNILCLDRHFHVISPFVVLVFAMSSQQHIVRDKYYEMMASHQGQRGLHPDC